MERCGYIVCRCNEGFCTNSAGTQMRSFVCRYCRIRWVIHYPCTAIGCYHCPGECSLRRVFRPDSLRGSTLFAVEEFIHDCLYHERFCRVRVNSVRFFVFLFACLTNHMDLQFVNAMEVVGEYLSSAVARLDRARNSDIDVTGYREILSNFFPQIPDSTEAANPVRQATERYIRAQNNRNGAA